MKNQKNLSFMVPLTVATMILAGCSDFDNGFTEKEMKFNADFTKEFGSYDETQDWNLAERANVTVITSELKDVSVYTEKDGQYVQVGAFKNVSGTKRLEFDVIEDIKNLVVSDGDVALRAVVGGTVNFDDMSSIEGEVMTTRGGQYMDRNLWSRDYRLPANITEAERAAVVKEFSKQHYGHYNTVLVPWTQMFVQQVYKGPHSYTDGFNNQVVMASDHMNRLMVWDNSSEYGKEYDNGYIHVNDFNSGDHSANGIDEKTGREIIGTTLMLNIDPTDCPTEEIGGKTWVKQFLYHNSTSNEYQPTYIMKRVTWVEDGVEKDGLYLGFDFFAEKPDEQHANRNMDVERDWIFDDWIIKVSQAVELSVPVSVLKNAPTESWILAGEDLGGGFDIDYNDVVVKVEYLAGEGKAIVTPLAAGGTLASYLFFGNKCIGEIHQLFNQSPSISGKYSPINLGSEAQYTATPVEVYVGGGWSLGESISKENNMGGFNIRVLPAGTPAKDKKLDNEAFDGSTVVSAPVTGQVPYIICVPFSFTLANVPADGQKTTNVWGWPDENVNIAKAYEYFERWVKNKDDKKDWYASPNTEYVVSTKKIAASLLKAEPIQEMTETEVEVSTNPNYDVSFYNDLPNEYPEVKIPYEYSLSLKEGVTEVSVLEGDEVDMLNYIETTYPDKVFCEATSLSDAVAVQGSKTKFIGGIGGNTTTVKVMLDTPTEQLLIEVPFKIIAKQVPSISLAEDNVSVAVGSTKTVTINTDSPGELSATSESDVFEVSVTGTTLSITAMKAGSGNIVIHQQSAGTYAVGTQYVWVAATQSSLDEDEEDDQTVNPDGEGVLLSTTKASNYLITVSEQKEDGTYDIYDGEMKTILKSGVKSIKLTWTENQASWGAIGQIYIGSNAGSYSYTSEAVISGSYSIKNLGLFTQSDGTRWLRIQNSSGVPFYLYLE